MRRWFSTLIAVSLIACLFALDGCGSSGDSGTPAANGGADTQKNTATPVNGLLDLGSTQAVVTQASDDSQPNLIQPASMNGVSHLKMTFAFNSGESTRFYFDPLWSYGLCAANGPDNQYPRPKFYLDDGNKQTQLSEQYAFTVHPEQDYKIIFDLQGIDCSDDGFEAEFGLRKEN